MSTMPALEGKSALVYSMGIEGNDLARWLLGQGAEVTMSDTRTADALAAAGAAPPEGVSRVVVGGPLLDPEGFDFVAVSQSVLRSNPAMERVRRLGLPFTSQMRLFLQLCPSNRVIGITGASGKSTTTSLVAAMAAAADIPCVVGGNLGVGGSIGPALLQQLPAISPETTVILEISHTQLQYTDRSPRVAALTNVTPNHLDQFTWDEYVGLKRHIFEYQGPGDVAVLNHDDQTSRALVPAISGTLWRTSLAGPVDGNCGWAEGDSVVLRAGGRQRRVANLGRSPLRGRHNRANIVMASVIAIAAGIPDDAVDRAVATFRGVPHRLEIVGHAGGATWVNDSIATTPERTVAGLASFSEPIVLLLGGREKHLPVEALQAEAARRCRAIVCFGEAGRFFFDALGHRGPSCELVGTMEEAVDRAVTLAVPGDVVLLSPAATSFDAYPNFEIRGQVFRELVRDLPGFQEVSG